MANFPDWREIRCPTCRRLLFKALGGFTVEIKCKCGNIVMLKHGDAR